LVAWGVYIKPRGSEEGIEGDRVMLLTMAFVNITDASNPNSVLARVSSDSAQQWDCWLEVLRVCG
jgi:hypothetical protein